MGNLPMDSRCLEDSLKVVDVGSVFRVKAYVILIRFSWVHLVSSAVRCGRRRVKCILQMVFLPVDWQYSLGHA